MVAGIYNINITYIGLNVNFTPSFNIANKSDSQGAI